MPKGQRLYSDSEREEVVRRVKAGETMYVVAKGMGIPCSTVELWVKCGWTEPRYSDAVKDEVVRRVQARPGPGCGCSSCRDPVGDGLLLGADAEEERRGQYG